MEFGITKNPRTLGNPMLNAVLKRIHWVIEKIVLTFNISTQTYVDKYDPWTGICSVTAFAIISTTNRKFFYSPGQLIFGREMILPIKHRVDWELIRQKKRCK